MHHNRSQRRRLMPPAASLVLGTLLTAGAVRAEPVGVYAHSEALLYSEPVSIEAAADDWNGEFRGGNIQWAYAWAEAGVKWREWSLGGLYRQEIALQFDRETAELYYRTEHDLPLEVGREYTVDIEAQRFSARGLRGAWHLQPTPEFQLVIGASIFRTKELQDGRLVGNATATAGDEYAFEGSLDYHYNQDYILKHDAVAPDGRGWALDLLMRWQLAERFAVSLKVVDLLGKIHWSDAPGTTARGYAADGVGSLSGRLSKSDYIQDLHPRFDLNAAAAVTAAVQAKARAVCQYGQCLYGLGFGTRSTRLLYMPQTDGIELRLGDHHYYVALMADSLDTEDMHSASVSVGINLP